MISKSTARSINASLRRMERNAQRRRKELQRQQKELAKMQEQERNRYEVAVYENYIDLISSVHKECSESWDWRAILTSREPIAPEYSNANERVAEAALTSYTPGIVDKIFKREAKKRAMFEKDVATARQKDREVYDAAMKQYQDEMEEVKGLKKLASSILSGDMEAFTSAIESTNPFSDIQSIGSQLSFRLSAPWYIEATLQVNGDEVIPTQEKSLTASGKVSSKNIPTGRRNEIYQDYVCGCVLRVARELFALLPIEMVIVHAMGELLNTSTGRMEVQPILSVAISRPTLDRFNFDTIDCSDSLKNFVHTMNFSKTRGFSAVEMLQASSFAPAT